MPPLGSAGAVPAPGSAGAVPPRGLAGAVPFRGSAATRDPAPPPPCAARSVPPRVSAGAVPFRGRQSQRFRSAPAPDRAAVRDCLVATACPWVLRCAAVGMSPSPRVAASHFVSGPYGAECLRPTGRAPAPPSASHAREHPWMRLGPGAPSFVRPCRGGATTAPGRQWRRSMVWNGSSQCNFGTWGR